jgi:hypothetical protein
MPRLARESVRKLRIGTPGKRQISRSGGVSIRWGLTPTLTPTQRWEAIFWIIALMPAVGIAVWMVLSRDQAAARV